MDALARKLENITSKGGMRLVDVANVLKTRPETVSRWNQGKASPHAGTEKQLLELEWIVDRLSDLYKPMEARLWLFSRQRLLDGQMPAELITENRTEEVLTLIGQLLEGTFT
jgi:uncharacterized protein (DUF2384 family)